MAGLAALVAAACNPGPGPMPDRVIDAHVHATFDGNITFQPYTRDQLLREWEGAGVVGAVVHLPRGSSAPPDLPGNVRYCAGIGEEPDVASVESALREGRIHCIKIYLGYVHRHAYDPVYEPLYDLAARYAVPVVFHTGDTSRPDARLRFAHPLGVDDVAVDHRSVTFVIAHCGNPWLETAAEVAYKNPNVYLECSALMTGDMDVLDPAAVERYVTDAVRYVLGYVEDPAKLMFATDWPLVAVEPYVRAYLAAVPVEHRAAVFHDNAARVFGFE
jgi:hypothetical protein